MKYMDDSRTPHDRLHQLLFGHREVVEDLLRHIVRHFDFSGDGKWLDELDWSTLKRESEISTAGKLDRRIQDIVWSLRWRGSPLYLILLIEFQSQVDRFMPLRLLNYLTLFYEGLVKSRRIGPQDKLPPALPICLFNGENPWRAPLRLEQLIAPCPKELRIFQPRFRYLLIEELKIPVDLSGEARNSAGTVFASQQISTREQLVALLDAIERWLPAEEYANLRRHILTLVRFAVPDELTEIGDRLHLEEFTMSPKEHLTRELHEYGEQIRVQSRSEGQRTLLAKLLRLKFGSLSASTEARLADATAEQLENWAGRVLVAPTLDDVWK
jgi:hypothetical protein